eukprot:12733208-Alexandrium_andersonii.AAC.1
MSIKSSSRSPRGVHSALSPTRVHNLPTKGRVKGARRRESATPRTRTPDLPLPPRRRQDRCGWHYDLPRTGPL